MTLPEQPKKTYETPRLYVFGDIGELTLTTGANGKNDGGNGNTKSLP